MFTTYIPPFSSSMDSFRINNKNFQPFISGQEIQQRVETIANQINHDFEGRSPLLIVVLNGAFVFAADLIRHLTIRPEVQFIRISSYGNSMSSSGNAQLLLGLDVDVEGKEVILIEDIIESGFTMGTIIDHLQDQNPVSVKLATLLFKPDQFRVNVRPDYIGFEIPNAFVIGYGMDYAQKGRELPDIYQLSESSESD